MKIYAIKRNQKDEVQRKITHVLNKREEVEFAYLHGSFLEGEFHDIDIALYLRKRMDEKEVLKYELSLEREVENIVNLPVDVRVLNHAPLSFRFNVIKNGLLLLSRDEELRCDFECLTIAEHHDFSFYRDAYRKEALGIKV